MTHLSRLTGWHGRTLVLSAVGVGTLLVTAAAVPVALAQAQPARSQPFSATTTTQTMASSATNSLCINPSGATSITGPDPTSPTCTPATPSTAVVVSAPLPWSAKIDGANWVSLNTSGSDASNPPPSPASYACCYYIYGTSFTLPATACNVSLRGEMLADNGVGVYLNKSAELAAQPDPLTPVSSNFTTPTTFSQTSGANALPPFMVGSNTLDFIVHDTTVPYTGLDFSATITFGVCSKIPTAVSLVLDPNHNGVIAASQPVSISGSVGAQGPGGPTTPTGAVSLAVNGLHLANAPTAVLGGNGSYELQAFLLPVSNAPLRLSISYGGDASFAPSVSPATAVSVYKSNTVTTITRGQSGSTPLGLPV